MASKVFITDYFEARYKRLKKKFPSLGDELLGLMSDLEKDPKMGEDLGGGIYKARLASKDKGKGKSGGFRVITYMVHPIQNETHLITIYDKSEEDSISKQDLSKIIKSIFGK